jgi:hypothetical protein
LSLLLLTAVPHATALRLLAFTAWSGLDFFVRALLLKAALYADCLLRWRCLLQPGWLL